jgi:hypothetical protein
MRKTVRERPVFGATRPVLRSSSHRVAIRELKLFDSYLRWAWLSFAVLATVGCASRSVEKRSPQSVPMVEPPEWTPTPVGLIKSLEEYPVVYPRVVPAGSSTRGPSESAAVAKPIAAAKPLPVPPPVATPVSAPTPAPASKPAPIAPPSKAETPAVPKDGIPVENAVAGTTVKFIASADGNPPLTFEWKKDGQPISGATHALLTIKKVSEADAGVYHCVVTNAVGSKPSSPFRLVIKKR